MSPRSNALDANASSHAFMALCAPFLVMSRGSRRRKRGGVAGGPAVRVTADLVSRSATKDDSSEDPCRDDVVVHIEVSLVPAGFPPVGSAPSALWAARANSSQMAGRGRRLRSQTHVLLSSLIASR